MDLRLRLLGLECLKKVFRVFWLFFYAATCNLPQICCCGIYALPCATMTAAPKPIGEGAPETAGTGAVAAQRERERKNKGGQITDSAKANRRSAPGHFEPVKRLQAVVQFLDRHRDCDSSDTAIRAAAPSFLAEVASELPPNTRIW